MLRRTAEEVGEPRKPIIVPHHIDADPKTINQIKGRAAELAKVILQQGEEYKGQKMRAAGELDMHIRQQTGVAKAPYVAEFVRLLHESTDEKIVLFGWHREVYEIWLEKLKDLNPVLYTGSESPNQKEAARKAFVEGDSKVIIISLRTGAGLDGLQFASHIAVFGELDFAPGVHEQCIGRLERTGQTHKVVVYYLLSDKGSDPVISDILGVKVQQLEGIKNPTREGLENLQIEEDYIKKLAEHFLKENGIPIPTQTAEAA
jgi:SNF2 family DNA or RNA helicase